jgi:hypothetical protein
VEAAVDDDELETSRNIARNVLLERSALVTITMLLRRRMVRGLVVEPSIFEAIVADDGERTGRDGAGIYRIRNVIVYARSADGAPSREAETMIEWPGPVIRVVPEGLAGAVPDWEKDRRRLCFRRTGGHSLRLLVLRWLVIERCVH